MSWKQVGYHGGAWRSRAFPQPSVLCPLSTVSSLEVILARLQSGRTVILGGDPVSSLLARGVSLGAVTPLGRLVREAPGALADLHQHEIAAGVDVLAALTAETMPRALAQIGMAFRSAALTGTAIELAMSEVDLAPRPIALAGLLGARWIGPTAPDRLMEEYGLHAVRLAASGCELILARGFPAPVSHSQTSSARIARLAAIVSAGAQQLPTWALVESHDGDRSIESDPLQDCVQSVADAGAQVVLVEVATLEAGQRAIERAGHRAKVGLLLAAADSLDTTASVEAWALAAKRLVDAGARAIGGGPGTTVRHIAALSRALGGGKRSSFWPRSI